MIQEADLGQNVRKISSGFFMLCLLFGEKASEGNNIIVDLFLSHRSCNTVRHSQKGSAIQFPYKGRYYSDSGQ